ncbi:hypothetical protein CRYUN_Cryun18bG0070000 [Craigia yunnanensis]
MGSLSGIIQRPLVAAAAVAMASVSADFSVTLPSPSSNTCSTTEQIETYISNLLQEPKSSLVDHISASKLANLSLVTRIRVPLPSVNFPVPNSGRNFVPNVLRSSVASSPLLVNLYQSAELAKASKPAAFTESIPTSAPDVLYRWHLPEPTAIDVSGTSDCSSAKSRTVVLLGYGAILEKFQKQDPALMRRIRGCIVDSAPVAAPDPQVWASGFSAAFPKKHSFATKGFARSSRSDMGALVGKREVSEPKSAVTEAALLLVLEKFFEVVLNLPGVNRRLSDVLGLLLSGQPTCPQLYIYSSADTVIPVDSVESFIEKQRRSGREVRACNFVS